MFSMLIQILKESGETSKSIENFLFNKLQDLVRKIVLSLDSFEANPVGNFLTDMLKSAIDIRLLFITKIINLSFENNYFPDDLKLAEVSPV